ncbi:C-type lectin domain family 14 member A [Tupaia chinensis]|uniref:C-type lectin domain family 14 member A n=1 Tax=Tupaia chinensis TaxID=246437 RepID=L9KK84_TUPCH|nr:C-type lectin domain family 14 member A [Tupaia chinensis]ELW63153.1 C-type lectin domain family 14 member A [Tupaia chinensis]
MRPAVALYLLWQALWPEPGSGEHPTADRADCSTSGACSSLHHSTIKRLAAEEACILRGGVLSTVHGGAELRIVLALLRAGPAPAEGSKKFLFWVALERGRSHCTLGNEPLRGFSWLSPDAGGSESDTLQWVEEPQPSCTVRRCAGLQATGGVEPAGWKETRCHLRANGYLCKYQYEGLCPAPRPGAASNLSYRAPFQLHSAAMDLSPPGTEVSALCPGQLFISATCVVDETGARWEGLSPGAVLCPCPGRYLRAGKCAELPNCLEDLGGFACECAEGFKLGKDGRSCVTSGETQPTPGGTKAPTRRPPATASNPVLKRTQSPRVHQKSSIPHDAGEGSSTSAPQIPQWGAQSTSSTLQISSQAKSKATTVPSESVIPKFDSTSPPAIPQSFNSSSSTVVFILVSIAVVVLVILTMTVLGLFKLCFHKSPSSQLRKGPLAPQGVQSDAEAATSHSSPAHCTENGVRARDCGLRDRAEDASLAGSSLGSDNT